MVYNINFTLLFTPSPAQKTQALTLVGLGPSPSPAAFQRQSSSVSSQVRSRVWYQHGRKWTSRQSASQAGRTGVFTHFPRRSAAAALPWLLCALPAPPLVPMVRVKSPSLM